MKTVANFRKTRFRGFDANRLALYVVGTAYNLIRISKLMRAAA